MSEPTPKEVAASFALDELAHAGGSSGRAIEAIIALMDERIDKASVVPSTPDEKLEHRLRCDMSANLAEVWKEISALKESRMPLMHAVQSPLGSEGTAGAPVECLGQMSPEVRVATALTILSMNDPLDVDKAVASFVALVDERIEKLFHQTRFMVQDGKVVGKIIGVPPAPAKSLGQVAYEAYIGIGAVDFPWDGEESPQSWQAAANAVVKANNERSQSTGPAIEAVLEKQLTEANARIAELEKELADAPNEPPPIIRYMRDQLGANSVDELRAIANQKDAPVARRIAAKWLLGELDNGPLAPLPSSASTGPAINFYSEKHAMEELIEAACKLIAPLESAAVTSANPRWREASNWLSNYAAWKEKRK